MKNLVVCGNCEARNGTMIKRWIGTGFNVELKRPGGLVLGQINDDGSFLIKRGGQNYTKITGDNFSVLCGDCGEPVYRKEEHGTDSNIRMQWIHWQGTISTPGESGTSGTAFA